MPERADDAIAHVKMPALKSRGIESSGAEKEESRNISLVAEGAGQALKNMVSSCSAGEAEISFE